jgi:hypothetical protein
MPSDSISALVNPCTLVLEQAGASTAQLELAGDPVFRDGFEQRLPSRGA